jgi:hypothetical protein
MRPTQTPNIAKAATRGMVISSPSMKILLTIISTVAGLPSRKQKPGAVGLRHCYRLVVFTNLFKPLTIVKSALANITECFVNAYLRSPDVSYFWAWLEFGPVVNISGKYPGSAGPAPAGNVALDFCHRSIPGTTLTEKRPALKLIWRLSASPVALCCKVRPLTSCLL